MYTHTHTHTHTHTYSPWGHKEADTTEYMHKYTHTHTHTHTYYQLASIASCSHSEEDMEYEK